MADYYVFHQEIMRRRRRKRLLILALVVLALLAAGAGFYYFSAGGEETLPVSAEPLVAAEPTPEPAPTEAPTPEPTPEPTPAGFAPKHLLPAVDNAAWDRSEPVEATIDLEYTNTDFRMVGLPMLGTVEFDDFSNTAFLGESILAGLGGYDSGLEGARFLTQKGGTLMNFKYTVNSNGTRAEPNISEEYVTNWRTGASVSMNPQEVLAAQPPDRIYMMFGTNTLVSPNGLNTLLQYYSEMLEQYQALLPGTPIYIMAITGVTPEAVARVGEGNNCLAPDEIFTANNILANIALTHGCYFVNTQEAMTNPDGTMKEEYSGPDGIHFHSVAEYRIMANYIATHVAWTRQNVYKGENPYYIYGT